MMKYRYLVVLFVLIVTGCAFAAATTPPIVAPCTPEVVDGPL